MVRARLGAGPGRQRVAVVATEGDDDAGDAAEDVDHDVAAHLHALGVHAEKQQTCQKGMGAGVES